MIFLLFLLFLFIKILLLLIIVNYCYYYYHYYYYYYRDWNNGTIMQHLALKAAIVLLAVGLQKPSQKSKAKDHQECLEKRLKLWKNGEIECLL